MTHVVEGFSAFSGHIIKDVIMTNMSYHDLHIEMHNLWCRGVYNSQTTDGGKLRSKLFMPQASALLTVWKPKPDKNWFLWPTLSRDAIALLIQPLLHRQSKVKFFGCKNEIFMLDDFHPFKQCHGHPSGNLFSSLFIHREWLEFMYRN